MARDVEIDIVANDKTSKGTRSAKKNFQDLERDTSKLSQKVAGFAEDMLGTVSKAASSAGPLIAGAAVVAAPLIGATISAAIIGGASIGAAGIGVAIASQNPVVKAAGSALGKTLMAGLQQDASVFVKPILNQLDKVNDFFKKENSVIANIFRNSAGFLDPLVDGALKGFHSILRGVDSLVAKGAPVVQAFGRSFDKIGGAVGNFFTQLSSQSKNGASAIDDLTSSVVYLVNTVSGITKATSATKGYLDTVDKAIDKGRYWVEDNSQLAGAFDTLGLKLDLTADGYKAGSKEAEAYRRYTEGVATAQDYLLLQGNTLVNQTDAQAQAQKNAATWYQPTTEEIEAQADALNTLAANQRNFVSENNSLYSSVTNAKQAIADATKEIKDNGKATSENTKKGRENRTAISDVATALNEQYQKTVDVYGAGTKATTVASENRAAFIKLAESAGYSAGQASDLADQLVQVPDETNTKAHYNDKDARARIYDYKTVLDGIPRTIKTTVYVSETGRERVDSSGHRYGGYSAAESMYLGSEGSHRTGGPKAVANMPAVNNNIQVTLDGSVLRSTIRESQKRQNTVNRVGKRFAYGR